MEKYYWEITEDLIQEDLVGVCNGDESLKDKEGVPTSTFELYDDDDILYCRGKIYGDFDGFEPQDDYGMPSLGVTTTKIDGETL